MAIEKHQKLKFSSKRKDINFFALKKVKSKRMEINIPPWIISILVPSLVVAVIASVYIYNQSTINRLEQELAASELQIEHANVDKQRPYMAKKTVERDIFSTYYGWISYLNAQFENFKTVQSEIPNAVTAIADGLVDISSFSATNEQISITGTGETMHDIADFQRKCLDIEDIETAFIPNMAKKTVELKAVEAKKLVSVPDGNGGTKMIEVDSADIDTTVATKDVYTFTFTATFKSRNSMMKEATE